MAAQQIEAPTRRRTTLIAVGLLLVALAVGAVTAVRLFPAEATQRPVAGSAAETRSLIEFRADERASLTQAADAKTPTTSLLDPSNWVAYTSGRYGFSIGHPLDWTVRPAARNWTFERDAENSLSPAQEVFMAPNQDIRVSAWSVALDSGTTIEGWKDLEPWIEAYCRKSNNTPCTGIHDRAVPLCNERRDCHPALLVPFRDDVQAFITGGNYGDEVVVAAVWWGESQPAVAPYGGSRRLLEAFLSTMGVWPPTGPDNHP